MSDPTTIIVPGAPQGAPAEQPGEVAEVLATAETVVALAGELAEQAAPEDRTHELIALISETRDIVREVRSELDVITAELRNVRAAQIVAEIVEETQPEAPEPEAAPEAPAHVEINQPEQGGIVEKETVIDNSPAPAVVRAEQKPARRWL